MRKILAYPLVIILFLLSTACSGIEKKDTPYGAQEKLETLHGISIIGDRLLIKVTTNGCTQKEHFKFLLADSNPKELTIIRTKFDACRKRKALMEIEYSLQSLGITSEQAFNLANPIRAFQDTRFS